MQAYIYCRVSSEEQASDNHYSLENQEKKARDYCHSKGWRVAGVRKDVGSGKDTKRDGYQELLTSIKGNRIDVVIVYRLDRLSRNVRDIYDFVDLTSQNDVALVSLRESLDTTTAMGRAMLGVMAVFAQLTREMIAENVKDGLMRRAQAGLYVGRKSGPFGYTYDPHSNALVPVPEEAESVRQVFHLFVDRKWGVDKIAQFLNESGLTTRSGVDWYQSLVSRLLRNPVYIGKVRMHNQTYDSSHEPIIDRDLFQAAQDIIASRSTLPGRSHQSQHLLSGLAECGLCGKRLVAHHGPAKKNGKRHLFYFHKASVAVGGCKSFYRSAAKLEKLVVDAICTAAASDRLSQVASEELHRQVGQKAEPLRAKADSIVAELAQIKGRSNAWADRLDAGLIDEEQFAQQNSRLLRRKQDLQAELASIDRQLAECESAEVSLEAAKKALADFLQVWNHLEIEERRELVRMLVEKLDVHKDHLLIKLVHLPAEMVKLDRSSAPQLHRRCKVLRARA